MRILGVLLAAGLTLPLLAQTAPPYRIDFNPQQDVSVADKDGQGNQGIFIHVRFTVTLASGKYEDIADKNYKLVIEEDGYRVGEEDVPRPTPVDQLSAMLALDRSGSMKERNRMVQAKTAAEEFLRRLPARADCGLILFDHEIQLPVLEPSLDRAALLNEIRKVEPRGGTAYLDAAAMGINMLGKAPAGREKAVVVMTDGVDLNSRTPINLVIHEAIKNKVRVFTVGIGEPGRQERVSSVLVLDHSGSMKPPADENDITPKIKALHRAAARFVEIMPATGLATIIPFSTDVGQPEEFTNNKDKLTGQIIKLQPLGETALFDATYAAIATLEAEGSAGKRAVVAMTDGIDNSSRRRVEEVIERAQEAKIPLYMLGFGREGELDKNTMERMANTTGGRFYHAKNEKALLDIFEHLSIELHDDGIDEIALKKLASETGGLYYPAKDVNQLKLILKQVTETITQKRYAVTVKSLRPLRDGTARNITLKLVHRGELVSNPANGSVTPGEIEVSSVKGSYQVHGVVVAEMNHLVYLGFLIVIGSLIALPAMLRRVTGAGAPGGTRA